MEYIETCYEGCQEEFVVHAPDRQDSRLTDGVPVRCEHCGHKYRFTVDGDGEPDLQSLDPNSLGDVITDPDATHY